MHTLASISRYIKHKQIRLAIMVLRGALEVDLATPEIELLYQFDDDIGIFTNNLSTTQVT